MCCSVGTCLSKDKTGEMGSLLRIRGCLEANLYKLCFKVVTCCSADATLPS